LTGNAESGQWAVQLSRYGQKWCVFFGPVQMAHDLPTSDAAKSLAQRLQNVLDAPSLAPLEVPPNDLIERLRKESFWIYANEDCNEEERIRVIDADNAEILVRESVSPLEVEPPSDDPKCRYCGRGVLRIFDMWTHEGRFDEDEDTTIVDNQCWLFAAPVEPSGTFLCVCHGATVVEVGSGPTIVCPTNHCVGESPWLDYFTRNGIITLDDQQLYCPDCGASLTPDDQKLPALEVEQREGQ
jgi:hypothetical protein